MPRIIDATKQNIVGDNIKRLRLANKWSQKQLSDKLETQAVYVCRGSMSRIEVGSRTVTDIEVLGFANAFNVPIGDLFE